MAKGKQLNTDVQIPEQAPEGHEIVVIGPYVWGAGQTLAEAVGNMKRSNAQRGCDYFAHVCPVPPEGKLPVNEMGQYYHCNPDKHCPHCR